MLTKLSENIKALIAENKTSIKSVAKAIGISTQSLSRYVNDHRLPDAEILLRIANHFNVSVDWLLGRDGYSKTICNEIISATKYTGLSEYAVQLLHIMSNNPPLNCEPCSTMTEMIDYIITSSKCNLMIGQLARYKMCQDSPSSIEDDLTDKEEKYFDYLLDKSGMIAFDKRKASTIYLQNACDILRDMFKENE